MKRIVLFVCLIVLLSAVTFAQNASLPRLAVVQFTTNDNTDKIKRDAITVRNLVESQMVETRKYQIITRDDIDKLLENQKIQVSSISSAENLKKLQLQNISYIVTGSLDAMESDYAITVRVLDVSTGQFSHSSNDFMGSGSRELYTGITGLMTKFNAGMSADEKGTIVQGQGGSSGSSAGASAYYGTWLVRNNSSNTGTLIIETNKITYRNSDGKYYVISNCTWTVANNTIATTIGDYPNGFKISGVVTDIHNSWSNLTKYLMPVYCFINKNDRNIILFHCSQNSDSEIQNGTFDIGEMFRKLQ